MMVAGCGGSYQKGAGQIQAYNFRQGTQGLSMKFMEGMPPERVFVGSEFSIGLRIKNEGAFSIKDSAELRIIVPDETAFAFDEKKASQSFKLEGKSLYIKDGEEDIIMFPTKALCFPGYDGTRASIVKNYTRKLKVNACYHYETTANADVCIDTIKYKRQESLDKPACQMKDVTFSGGQGGPVGVVKISPSIIPQSDDMTKLKLSISLKKLQGDDHTIYGPSGGCNVDNQNQAEIMVQMGNEILTCTPYNLKLRDEGATTECEKLVDPNAGAYITPITVTIRYYVEQNLLKQMTLEGPPGGIDCVAIGGKASGSTGTCTAAHPGYSCKQIICNQGEDISGCASRNGCYRGLCPGGTTNVCCP